MQESTNARISKPADIVWASNPPKWVFPCSRDGRYRIFAVSTPALRSQARRLVNNVYQKQGYTFNRDDADQNFSPEGSGPAFTVMAEDAFGEMAGTVSLNLDGRWGLPCDEIFGEELTRFRTLGRPLAEVTGFAISEKHTRSKALLVHLLDFIFVLARQECPNGMVVIEVNPRHEKYYQKLMNFKEAGPVRSCHRVRGAPARLLSLDLTVQHETIRAVAGTKNVNRIGKSRSLYTEFYTLEDEVHIRRFLKRSGAEGQTVRSAERFVLEQVS